MNLGEVSARLVKLVSDHYQQEIGGSPTITAATKFADLGLDALDFMQIADAVEEEFNVAVPHLFDFWNLSIEDLARGIVNDDFDGYCC